jgi:phosphate-selective porin OprO/OprP
VVWQLDGEARPFDRYNARLSGEKPKVNFFDGGHAAWQLAARVSHVDLTDGDVIGGKQTNVSFGVTWVPDPYVRIMGDLIKVANVDRPNNEADGKSVLGIQLRFQIEF